MVLFGESEDYQDRKERESERESERARMRKHAIEPFVKKIVHKHEKGARTILTIIIVYVICLHTNKTTICRSAYFELYECLCLCFNFSSIIFLFFLQSLVSLCLSLSITLNDVYVSNLTIAM